jgi:uncharacterized protein (TIGR03437 family)
MLGAFLTNKAEVRMNRAVASYRFLAATVFAALAVPSPAGTPPQQTRRPAEPPLSQTARANLNRDYGNLPLYFEPNQGQAASTVQFLSRGSGYALFLTPGKVVLNLERQQPASAAATGQTPEAPSVDTLCMSLIGANAKANAVGVDRQPGVVSYFIGNDPKNWRSGILTYGKVAYPQIYPGVDLVFYGNQRQFEYDFVVAPGADPSRIAWRIDGARASVDAEGNLALSAPNGPASFRKPVLYQMDGDKKTSVEGSFAVAGNQIRFRLGSYDHSRALIIDPVLSYASYLGGSSTDNIGRPTDNGPNGTSQGLALDSAGSAYVTGYTYSIDFPTKNPYKSAPPAKVAGVPPGQWPSAFVTKFSPDGGSLVYSTYLGGNGYDFAYAIAVDSSGSAYVTGETDSPDFPVTAGAYQTVCNPVPNNTGASSASPGCNTALASAFVTKLNATGTGIVYSTFLGGYASWAYATAIAVDGAGRAYIAGNEDESCSTNYTFQSCFPTTSGAVIGGSQTRGGDPQFAFVAAFDPTGAHLIYSTIFGDLNFQCTIACGGDTYGTGIAVDANGYFYLVGETKASNLPTTAGVIQPTGAPLGSPPTYVQAWRGFIAKFNPVTSAGGASLAYATYLGGKTGNTGDFISGITIDSASNAYIVGYTNSKDFPVTNGAYQTVCGPSGQTCAAAHVTKLNPSATAYVWSTYVGGGKSDGSDTLFYTGPIQLDGNGNIYIMGQIGTTFPITNPIEPTPISGSMQVLVAELDPTGSKLLFSTMIGSKGLNTTSPAGLAVNTAGDIYLAGNTNGPDLITTTGAFQTTSSDGACCQKGNGFVVKMASTTPQITLAGIGNAANYVAGKVAPGEIIVVYGTTFGPSSLATITYTDDIADTTLGKTRIYFDGVAAPMVYAVSGQLSCVVPYSIYRKTSTVVQVEYDGVKGNSLTVPVVAAVPGIFSLDQSGTGAGAILNWPDYSVNSITNRVAAGGYVMIYATGEGTTDTAIDGQKVPLAGPYPAPLLTPWTATVGGKTATVIYAGSAPTNVAGLFQVNVQIPSDLTAGIYNVVISAGGFSSQSGLTVAVQ